MRSLLFAAALAVGLAASGGAHAALTVSASVGGAPTGVNYFNFNTDAPSGQIQSVTFSGTAAGYATGSASGIYAAPYISNGNGLAFGDPDGVDASRYVTSGIGSATVTFATTMKYVGLLWGSVDRYNTLSFYDGATFVGSITGANVTAAANGDQGVNGTYYVNVTSDTAFDRIVATSSQYAFEFDNLAYNTKAPPPDGQGLPEPGTLGLIGAALLGLAGLRRRAR